MISKEDAIDYGLTGPNLRGSGVDYDLRKAHPYLVYDQLKFDVPVGSVGDCYDRYLVRMEEMRQSVRILQQCLDQLPGGPVSIPNGKTVLPPKEKVLTKMEELIHQFILVTQGVNAPPGEIYFGAENPEGRTRLLHQQQGRRHAAPAEDPRAVLRQPEHPAASAARPHDERHRRHPRLAGFCHGRMRPITTKRPHMKTAQKSNPTKNSVPAEPRRDHGRGVAEPGARRSGRPLFPDQAGALERARQELLPDCTCCSTRWPTRRRSIGTTWPNAPCRLGGYARGTVRMAAAASQLPEWPENLKREADFVKAVADRFAHRRQIRSARRLTAAAEAGRRRHRRFVHGNFAQARQEPLDALEASCK